MRIGYVEWPEALEPNGKDWAEIVEKITNANLDVLVTNELPFGPWIAACQTFDYDRAQKSVDIHIAGIQCLAKLPLRAVISSRPVWSGSRLLNEAVSIEDGEVRALHHKQYFPEEPGWFEASWYAAGHDNFRISNVAGIKTGVLLCTDAMFNEHARAYGRSGAELIVIPRATEASDMWLVAGQMAAIVSGSFVVSSNRVSHTVSGGPHFGGRGFSITPDGSLITCTNTSNPLAVMELDKTFVSRQRLCYPCYVREKPF